MSQKFLSVTADLNDIGTMRDFASEMAVFSGVDPVTADHKYMGFLRWDWPDQPVTVEDVLPFSAAFPNARLSFGVMPEGSQNWRVTYVIGGEIVGDDSLDEDAAPASSGMSF